MTIELVSPSSVVGPRVFLRDVAMFNISDPVLLETLGGVDIGPAPLPGKERVLTLGQIQVRMRQRKIDPAAFAYVGPSRVVVQAVGIRVPAAQIEAAAVQAVCQALPQGVFLDSVSVARSEGDLVLAGLDPGAAQVITLVAAVADNGLSSGLVKVDTRVILDGAELKTTSVWLRVSVSRDVLVAVKWTPMGASLGSDDVRVERRPAPDLSTRVIPASPESVAGMRTRRAIPQGAVLLEDDIEPVPPLLGQAQVTLLANSRGIKVSVPAVALEDGWPGRVIRVRNTISGLEVMAVVSDAETVIAILDERGD
jgi:flagella basal body P-ring formation protein FlgA